ncbi:MAG TPA: glycosyltransferase [Acidobacteriaceae bacterium]|nr:glycosyltransferase [Acidobacteriaceae bacterium]
MLTHQRFSEASLVSAVIPTRGRPELLLCAIRSAFHQTWRPMEVIVVIDGPDADTEARLAQISDARLRVVILPEISGGCIARNAGVRAACGDWIAFLDDDDEWLPEKIERQMSAIAESDAWFPVLTCRLIAHSPTTSRMLPPRVYDSSQPVADYLFCRTGLTDPGGLIQTSTLLASRDLLLAIPFREGLRMHQDWDWVIRVASHEGVTVTMLPKPLVIWRVDDGRATVGRSQNWQFSLAWIREMRRLVSGRAFSAFIAIQCVWRAQSSRANLFARLRILWAFLVEGQPEWRSSIDFLAYSVVPASLRKTIRNRVGKHRPGVDAGSGLSLAFTNKTSHAPLRKTSR